MGMSEESANDLFLLFTELKTKERRDFVSAHICAKLAADAVVKAAEIAAEAVRDAARIALPPDTDDQLGTAWGVIANAKNWTEDTPGSDWLVAAERWRDHYFASLPPSSQSLEEAEEVTAADPHAFTCPDCGGHDYKFSLAPHTVVCDGGLDTNPNAAGCGWSGFTIRVHPEAA
jgi:hypothetical protein